MFIRNFKELLPKVKAFAFDVDGVCTGNELYLLSDGELMRKVNTRDGLAMHLAIKAGYPMAIITGGRSESVRERFHALGVQHVFIGVRDKRIPFKNFCEDVQVKPEEVLYMGDDLPDIAVMRLVGLPTCPADAALEVRQESIYISPCAGGKGAVRDVIEQTMKVQGRWWPKE